MVDHHGPRMLQRPGRQGRTGRQRARVWRCAERSERVAVQVENLDAAVVEVRDVDVARAVDGRACRGPEIAERRKNVPVRVQAAALVDVELSEHGIVGVGRHVRNPAQDVKSSVEDVDVAVQAVGDDDAVRIGGGNGGAGSDDGALRNREARRQRHAAREIEQGVMLPEGRRPVGRIEERETSVVGIGDRQHVLKHRIALRVQHRIALRVKLARAHNRDAFRSVEVRQIVAPGAVADSARRGTRQRDGCAVKHQRLNAVIELIVGINGLSVHGNRVRIEKRSERRRHLQTRGRVRARAIRLHR